MPIPLYGFTLDTTMAVTGLIYQGILERFPRLKIIHPHLGGMFPYMVARVESTFLAHSKDDGISLPEPPTTYYRRNVYIDAVSFHIPAMRCALDFVGSEHLLIGTDYAHPDGGADKVLRFIKDLRLSDEDNEKILWRNATKLFRLDN
jgi:aminocarboxymuconate-semialdehyde decarboxylase